MIINKSGKVVVSTKEIAARSFLSQALGLMFRKKQNLVMFFNEERKISLHNLFVFYPLEVLVLDEEKRVVEIKKDFRLFAFWSSGKKGKYLLELGREESQGKVGVGDRLEIREQ